MKVHRFEHAPLEGPGAIEGWLLARGYTLSCTRFYAGEAPPENADGFDWLIVMGGSMNVYQYRDHPWLRAEKHLIRAAIAADKRVLGSQQPIPACYRQRRGWTTLQLRTDGELKLAGLGRANHRTAIDGASPQSRAEQGGRCGFRAIRARVIG